MMISILINNYMYFKSPCDNYKNDAVAQLELKLFHFIVNPKASRQSTKGLALSGK